MNRCTKGPYYRYKCMQGYPQKTRLQRRLYGMYSVFFVYSWFPATVNLFFFSQIIKSLNKPLNDCYATKSSRSELPLHAKDVKPLKSRGKQVRTAATKLVLICKLYLIYLYCVRQLSSVTLNILIQKYYCCDLLIAH